MLRLLTSLLMTGGVWFSPPVPAAQRPWLAVLVTHETLSCEPAAQDATVHIALRNPTWARHPWTWTAQAMQVVDTVQYREDPAPGAVALLSDADLDNLWGRRRIAWANPALIIRTFDCGAGLHVHALRAAR